MRYAGWIVAGCLLLVGLFMADRVEIGHSREREALDRRIDSVEAVNASLRLQVDSLMEASQMHVLRSDSLIMIPQYIYVNHAARLTRSASLDSLGMLLGSDPFAAVPDTLYGDDEPR